MHVVNHFDRGQQQKQKQQHYTRYKIASNELDTFLNAFPVTEPE